MVLVQSAPKFRSFPIHPNPARVAGAAIAIVLNAVVLFAMTLFMRAPLPMPAAEADRIPIHWVLPEEKQEPPPEPPVVPVAQPHTERPQPVQQRTETPPIDMPPVVTQDARAIDVPYLPPEDTAPAVVEPGATPGPVAGVRLEYASAPAPTYPREELMAGREGTVMLQVLVDVDGTPLEVGIHTSSGNRRLDRAAQQQVLRHWTFRPATRDGRPIQAIGLVPIDFRLH